MDLKKISLGSLWLIILSSSAANAIDINDVNRTDLATGIIKQDARSYVPVCWEDAKKTFFDRNNLIILLLAGGGSIAFHETEIDKRAAEHFEENGRMSKDLDKFVDMAGNPGIHFAGTGIWYLMAMRNKDDINLQRSWVMLRALGITGAMTLTLKAAVHNHTPNDKNWAWPSGHTASSFCVASVLDEFYGPKIGIPAYLGAGFVGYRMMESGDHWASDVLFGGVLGYVVGHTVAGQNKDLTVAGFRVQPLFTNLHSSPAAGVGLNKEF